MRCKVSTYLGESTVEIAVFLSTLYVQEKKDNFDFYKRKAIPFPIVYLKSNLAKKGVDMAL